MTENSSLASLSYIPYIDEIGYLPPDLTGKIGVYAIFDQDKILCFIGYSRDIYLSLKQHFVRQHQSCYWLKIKIIDKPNRTILENIKAAWITENGVIPIGNDSDQTKWHDPIDIKLTMTDEEKNKYLSGDELMQIKLLKTLARKAEEEILTALKVRGIKEEIRFNPKLKENGLLDLK